MAWSVSDERWVRMSQEWIEGSEQIFVAEQFVCYEPCLFK